MVPEVGREAIADVRSSISGMAKLSERVIASGADTSVLIAAQAPLESQAFVAYDGPLLYGDFASLRAPAAAVFAELDDELLTEIVRAAAAENLLTLRIRGRELDHGTAVPLYFLQRNGWNGRVVELGYSFLSNEDHVRFGKCIRAAVDKLGRPVAFIASGDLSHRLKPEAPAGFNPQAHLFDEEVVDAIHSCATRRIVDLDPELRRMAGECGYRSMLVAIGAGEGLDQSCELFSYEAPFGVGYLVAQLYAAGRVAGSADVSSAQRAQSESVPNASAGGPETHADTSHSTGAELPGLARRVIETFVTTGQVIATPQNPSDFLNQRTACFVSIKTHAGDLRGCIGTIEPVKDTLAEELIVNAVGAATRDPRFPPVRADELPGLKYSVDVLSAPEPTTIENLDPNVYGVIVEDANGIRRGLLLPHLEGIDTAARQVEIASRKAGIPTGSEVKLWRFRADRYGEE